MLKSTVNAPRPGSGISQTQSTARCLWKMIANCGSLYMLHTLFWVMHQFGPLLPGIVFKWFFDSLSRNGPVNTEIWPIIGVFFAISVARSALVLFAAPVDMLRAFYTVSLLRRNLLAGILRLPGAAALSEPVGEAIARFRDDPDQVEDFLSNVPDIVGSLLSALTATYVLWTVNRQLTVLVFIPTFIIGLIARAASAVIQERRRAMREVVGKVTGLIAEAFTGIQLVQVYGAQASLKRRMDVLLLERKRAVLQDRLLSLLLESLESGTATLGTGVILLLAANLINLGSFTIGDFALFASYLVVISKHNVYFGTWAAQYRQTGVSFERMAALLKGAGGNTQLLDRHPLYFARHPEGEEVMPPPAAANERMHHLKSLEIRYLSYEPGGDSRLLLEGLEVTGGSLTVVAGRVGAGKSTLLRALLGLLPDISYEVLWNGCRLSDLSVDMTPPRAAYVSQIPLLLGTTIRENIDLGYERTNLYESIHAGVLQPDLETMELGLETVVGVRGVRLSGGQVQRVALARALAQGSQLLVFDDLSSALDVETEEILWSRVRRLNKTIIAVSNRQSVWQMADTIIVMKDGHVVDSGPYEALLGRCEEMRELSLDPSGGV